jgi:nucleoside phosphorylase
MNRLPEYFRLARYDITPANVVGLVLQCRPDQVRPRVIITPYWGDDLLADLPVSIEVVAAGRVFDVDAGDFQATFVRSGIGAPLTGDTVLALGCTPCRILLFTGSMGGLDPSLEIGDLVLERSAVSGDGWSRNLDAAEVPRDRFLEPAYPDAALTETLREVASRRCADAEIPLHEGAVYSSDTIVAQFPRVEYAARELDCIGVEMETAAVFNASRLVGVAAAALLQISDVIPAKKSLFSGRTPADAERRWRIRRSLLADILAETLRAAG